MGYPNLTMNIAVWAEDAHKNLESGTHVFMYYLLKHLLALDRNNRYAFFVSRPPPAERRLSHPHLTYTTVKDPNDIRIWGGISRRLGLLHEHLSLELAWSLKKAKADVYFAKAYIAPPLWFRGKYLSYAFDLSFLIYPDMYTEEQKAFLGKCAQKSLRRAERIIAISENTKKDIIQFYKIPPEKIKVVYLGIDREIFKPLDPAEDQGEFLRLKDSLGIKGRYFLFLGEIQPRKNLLRAVKAFNILKENPGTEDVQFILVGRQGWHYQGLLEEIRKSPYQSAIKLSGSLPSPSIVALMQNALVMVYVSLYEGFGLPCLEAMACGLPVIASSTSSLPEVVGNAGIMIDPCREEAIAEAMAKVLRDENLRTHLREAGLARTRLFSWEKAGQEILEEIRNV